MNTLTLTERMNLKAGEVAGAHIIRNVNMGFASYDTFCLACSELGEDVSGIDDIDFETASDAFKNFAAGLNDDTGYTFSIWFD